jgi:hypothetical protein
MKTEALLDELQAQIAHLALFALAGAIARTGFGYPKGRDVRALVAFIADWNDEPGRQVGDVLAVFDDAIGFLEGRLAA